MKSILTILIISTVAGLSAIPSHYQPPSGWENYEWNDPGNWKTIDVTDYGLEPNNPDIDASATIAKIIDGTEGRRSLYFPEGTYFLKTQCTISVGDIRIRGDGIGKTVFKITSDTDGIIHGFEFKGTAEEKQYAPRKNQLLRGASQIETRDLTPYQTGDFILAYSPEKSPVDKEFWRGQIFQITEKRNQVLQLDMKSGIDMPIREPLTLWRLFMIDNIALEDFSIERLHKNAREGSNIVFEYCHNVLVTRVESAWACFSNIRARACRKVIVEHCKMHGAWDTSGGWAYGVNFHRATTEARASFNEAWNLRHGINISAGANHCIMSYNTSKEPYVSYQDVGVHHGGYAHNILFEGNRGKEIVTDPSGLNKNRSEYVVYFRNYAISMLGPQQELSENHIVVGNVVENPAGLYLAGNATFSGMNLVGGTLISGFLSEDKKLPHSLYLSERPQLLDAWPRYGPK